MESGNREQARAEADAALKLAPNRDVRAIAALALARAGDTAAAEKLAAELDKTFPAGHAGPEILAAHDPGSSRVAAQRPEPGGRTIEGGEHDRTWPTNKSRGIPMPGLSAWRSLSHAARRQRSSNGISEVHRPSRIGGELSLGRAGPPRPGPRLCNAGRHAPKPRPPIRTSSPSGKTPTPTSPS